MASRRNLPPRHLSYLFVGITLALASALVWLGFELVRQDRALEAQRVRDDLQRVTATAAEVLTQRLTGVEDALGRLLSVPVSERASALANWGDALGSGAIIVDLSDGSLRAAPASVLRYDPSFTPGTSLSPDVFATGEVLEFREQNLAGAMEAYRALVTSIETPTRANALLRLGRVLQKQRDFDDAITAFKSLAALNVEFHGVPAELLAGHALLGLYEVTDRSAEAEVLAESLAQRLGAGTWRLTRSSYEYYAGEIDKRRRTGGSALVEPTLLTRAVDSLYRSRPEPGTGRDVIVMDSVPMLRIWRAAPDGRVEFVATPEYVVREWLAPLQPVLQREGVSLALADASGRWMLPPPREGSVHRVVRTSG